MKYFLAYRNDTFKLIQLNSILICLSICSQKEILTIQSKSLMSVCLFINMTEKIFKLVPTFSSLIFFLINKGLTTLNKF